MDIVWDQPPCHGLGQPRWAIIQEVQPVCACDGNVDLSQVQRRIRWPSHKSALHKCICKYLNKRSGKSVTNDK